MFGPGSAQGRAILAGAVLLALLASTATMAVWRTQDLQERHHALEHTSAAATALQDAYAQFAWEQDAVLSMLIFGGEPTLVEAYHDAAAATEQNLRQARTATLARGKEDEILALDDLAERIGQFNEQVDLALPFLLEVDPETRIQLVTTSRSEMWSESEAIVADLGEMVQEEQQELAARREAADRAAGTTLWLLIGFSAFAFLVAAGVIGMFVVSVVRPLAALRASARAITGGDLEARAKLSGPEEVTSLARDFNEMTDALAVKTKELEVRAITDGLTGLYNHAHFYQRLAEEIERSQRYGRGFAVVMMDVDNFKQYNDSRGHQAGDEALRLVADCIRSGLRRSDLAFRYGGDEFAAILVHADPSKAQAVLDRINRRIAKGLKQTDNGAAARVSLSAGVACFPDDGTTADDLVRIADTALYDAKRAARPRDMSRVASN